MMKITTTMKRKLFMLAALAVIGSSATGLYLTTGVGAVSAATTAVNQARLAVIIQKGDQEISRRLTTMSTLTAKIAAATKLTAADQATLSAEVGATTTGLTGLKTQLDAETTLAGARTDVTNIYSEYRVYALVAPKVNFIKVADDQQVVEAKLTALAQKLQTRIATDQKAGKDVTALQAQLADMNTNISAAKGVSGSIEAAVINLQPTDFNNDHSILSGYAAQLKSARANNQAAFTDAKAIVAGLKTL